MSELDKVSSSVRSAIKELAKDRWREFRDAAENDGLRFAEKAKTDLLRWAKLVASGHITKAELSYLVRAKYDLAHLEAMKRTGLSVARLSSFKSALTRAMVGAVVEAMAR